MTYPVVFSIILLYNLYISIVVQSKLQTDHFVKIREKKVTIKSIFRNNKVIRTAKIALEEKKLHLFYSLFSCHSYTNFLFLPMQGQ